jgi:phosphoribosylanthranilate isomerase
MRVKICGITSARDARWAVELGAAYLGLNFYPKSPRFLTIERAREIADAVERRVPLVGVFVNVPAEEVREIADRVGLDRLQFHGDESPEWMAPFATRAIKAFRGVPRDEVERYPDVRGFLFDAPPAAASVDSPLGGTGRAWDYSALAPLVARLAPRPVFLAGGIGPDNVRTALSQSGASLVDVCSRVESAPGVKDLDLLRRLFAAVGESSGDRRLSSEGEGTGDQSASQMQLVLFQSGEPRTDRR